MNRRKVSLFVALTVVATLLLSGLIAVAGTTRSAAASAMMLTYAVSPNDTVTIPIRGYSPDLQVNWGDGNVDTYTGDEFPSHTYTSVGPFTVSLIGTSAAGFGECNVAGISKLTDVLSWGGFGFTSLEQAFCGATALTTVPAALPSSVTNLSTMFNQAQVFNFDISGWDVGNVIYMAGMFSGASLFNRDLNSWNVSKVTNMRHMFDGATVFNGDISNWNVGAVEDMAHMFQNARAFNQDISLWNTSNLTTLFSTFAGASSFDYSLNSWDVSKVNDMQYTFSAPPRSTSH